MASSEVFTTYLIVDHEISCDCCPFTGRAVGGRTVRSAPAELSQSPGGTDNKTPCSEGNTCGKDEVPPRMSQEEGRRWPPKPATEWEATKPIRPKGRDRVTLPPP